MGLHGDKHVGRYHLTPLLWRPRTHSQDSGGGVFAPFQFVFDSCQDLGFAASDSSSAVAKGDRHAQLAHLMHCQQHAGFVPLLLARKNTCVSRGPPTYAWSSAHTSCSHFLTKASDVGNAIATPLQVLSCCIVVTTHVTNMPASQTFVTAGFGDSVSSGPGPTMACLTRLCTHDHLTT